MPKKMTYDVTLVCLFVIMFHRSQLSGYMILSPQMNVDKNQGTSVKFKCTTDVTLKSASHKAYWLFGNRIIGDLSDAHMNQGRMKTGYEDEKTIFLDLNSITTKDAGTYKCQINIRTDNDDVMLDQTHYLIVLVAPKLKPFESSNVSLAAGSRFEILCETELGTPPPDIYWLKKSEKMDQDDDYLDSPVTDSLVIFNATLKDGGMYICLATNKAGSSHQVITITIKHQPILKDASPAIIHSGPDHTTVLFCMFSAFPQAIVLWKRNEIIINFHDVRLKRFKAEMMNTKLKDVIRYKLTINNMTEMDFGQYECSARNSQGSNKRLIEVSAKPALLTIISLNKPNTYSDRYTLEWSVASYSNLFHFYALLYIVNETRETFYKNISILPNNQRLILYYSIITETKENYHQSVVITDLPEATNFSLQMIAINKYGSTPWTDVGYFHTVSGVFVSTSSSAPTLCAIIFILCFCIDYFKLDYF